MAVKDDYLIDLLVDMGYVTNEQLEPIREEANNTGEGVIDLLVSRHVIGPQNVAQAKAAHFSVEFIALSELKIPDDVISAVPRHVAKRYRAVPVSKYGSSIRIAVTDPSDLDTLDSLQRSVSGDPEWCVATDEDLDAALNKYYGAADDSVGKMIQDITNDGAS